ncbi:MAG TPA: copper chaperone PCu(A)C [Ramlibacter sp.]
MHRLLTSAFLLAACVSLQAQTVPVTVEGAWARASVQGQSGTGAFMTLTAREPLSLVGVATPVAGVAELHEMRMDGDVMRMRAAGDLPLVPGKPLELKPGGYHLMLMELKAPLAAGTQVPVSLRFRDAKGVVSTLQVSVPVAVRAPAAHKH